MGANKNQVGGQHAKKEWRKRATLRGPGGSVRIGKDHAVRKHSLDHRRRPAQGLGAGKNTVGDASLEARARQMSVETNCADDTISWTNPSPFSIAQARSNFSQEALNVLPGIDAAIVVCEPDANKAAMLQPYLKRLSDLNIPHALFVNKIDKATGAVREVLATLQQVSPKPLVLRQIPIWKNGIATGFVDLALERAYVYRNTPPPRLVEMNDEVKARETEARFQMLEKLADYDEHLMEELLSDVAAAARRDLRRNCSAICRKARSCRC